MITGKYAELAALVARLNRGNIVLAGPLQTGDDGFGVKIIAGGDGRQVLQFEASLSAEDAGSAKLLRDAFIGELAKQLELQRSRAKQSAVCLHECRDERELVSSAAEHFPNRDLEIERVKLLGGGTA